MIRNDHFCDGRGIALAAYMLLIQDLRFGLRTLAQSPAATIVAVMALALGIGVNISSFIGVNSMVLHPFPFPRLERIMTVWESEVKTPDGRDTLAPGNFVDWKSQTRSFEETAAYRGWAASLTGTKESAGVHADHVSASFFRVLGARAMMGRTFTRADEQAGNSRTAVISEGFWRQHFSSAPNIIGKSISINGESYSVIGVMPAEFDFPLTCDVWAPLNMTPRDASERADRNLQVIGLLKPDVSVPQAAIEAGEIASRLQQQYPDTNRGRNIRVLPILTVINEVTDKFILLLLGAASMVLLLSCANVMNLQLARAARREKEIAVRAALGASRFQIARQLIVESTLMAIVGGVCALFLAGWNLDVMKARIPAEAFAFVPGLRSMQIDGSVIAYTFGISILAGVLASVPAIFRLLRRRSLTDLNEALQMGGRTADSAASTGRNSLQAALIVVEVAMALVLLVGAALMVQAFNGLLKGSYGYETRNLLRLQVALPGVKYAPGSPRISFYDRALVKLASLPGVQAAAVWSDGPLVSLTVEGRPAAGVSESRPQIDSVSGDFLRAMHMPLLQGRFLSEKDRLDTNRVVVLSQSVAREYWPDSDPIGKRIRLGAAEAPWLTVVGVAGDLVQDWLTNRPSHLVYVPYTQTPLGATTFVTRTTADPKQLASAAQDKLREIEPDLPIYSVRSMDQFLYEQMSGVRAAANSMTTYATVAMVLASTGIFGVISFFIAQRTRDIGVHMALGANSKDVLAMTIRQTLGPSLIGVGIGLAGAFFLSNMMSSLLFHLVKLDGWTFLICTVSLIATAFLASYLPALRATRIDPLIALRDG